MGGTSSTLTKSTKLKLSQRFGYEFKDESLLELALTHRSRHEKNNERLEFLGDSILNFVIADALFHQFENNKEGELSRQRAFLVKGRTLTEIANEKDLGEFIKLGQGELKSGGSKRDSILADSVEAIFGAIFLDSDFQKTRDVILNVYAERLKTIRASDSYKDPKTRLQEHQQQNKLALPIYEVLSMQEGLNNEHSFEIHCTLPQLSEGVTATGRSRRAAEKNAAQLALDALGLGEKL